MTRHCLKTKIKKNFQQHGTFKMMRFEWNEFFFCKKIGVKNCSNTQITTFILRKAEEVQY